MLVHKAHVQKAHAVPLQESPNPSHKLCLNPEIRSLPELANHKREPLLYYDDPTSDTSTTIVSYQYHMHQSQREISHPHRQGKTNQSIDSEHSTSTSPCVLCLILQILTLVIPVSSLPRDRLAGTDCDYDGCWAHGLSYPPKNML